VTVLTPPFFCVRMVLPSKEATLNSNRGGSIRKEAAAFARTRQNTKVRKTEMTKERTKKYTSDMPRRLYSFFHGYSEAVGAPSFSKFARSIGVTLKDVQRFRKHSEFERAYEECNEIRRDYLIDNALCKRFDGSVTKFLLTAEFGMGERENEETDNRFDFTLEVLSGEKK